MKKTFFIAILLITAAGLGLYWLGYTNGIRLKAGSSPKKILENETVIFVTEEGFVPDEIIIKPGTTVKFMNKDTLWHWPASDLHPTHNLYQEFDPRRPIAPGEEWSFTFAKTGDWTMHDHLAPYIIGAIYVSE